MNNENLMKILLAPHISEKSTLCADNNNRFVFRVLRSASKPQIKKAVELMFDVKVDNVRVLNVKGKSKRHGNTSGTRSGWKKAYVALQDGFDIDYHGPQ